MFWPVIVNVSSPYLTRVTSKKASILSHEVVFYTVRSIISVLSAGSDVQKLGRLACSHALPCFEHVVAQLAQCSANDDSFYETALENARSLLEPLIDTYTGSFEEFLVCHFGEDSDVITLLRLVS